MSGNNSSAVVNNSSAVVNNFGFWLLFKTSFLGVFKKAGCFIFYGFVSFLVFYGLYFLLAYSLFIGQVLLLFLLFSLLIVVAILFLGVFTSLLFKNITKYYLHLKSASFFSYFLYSFKNLFKGTGVALRVFWYVFKWLILFSLVFAMLSPFIHPTVLSAIKGFIETILYEGYLSGTEGERFVISGTIGFVIGLVVVINRFPKVLFAMTVFVEDNVSGRKALAVSQRLVKGRWWKVFLYSLIAGLIFSLISFVVSYFVAFIIFLFPFNVSEMAIFTVLVGGIMVLFSILATVFIYKFYLELGRTVK